MTSLPPIEQIHASAIRFLIDGHEEDAANVLLSCSLLIEEAYDERSGYPNGYIVKVSGPRSAYDKLINTEDPVRKSIQAAIQAVLPEDMPIRTFTSRGELIVVDPDWKDEMRDVVRGKGVSNQVVDAEPGKVRTWANLRFRSESEVRIAQALDKAEALFLPNCKSRLNTPHGRANKEPDFLVCFDGKWGILEVDGEPFHPPSRTVQDHQRDRLFRNYGLQVVEHFDANECFTDPDGVVKKFLAILK